MKPTVIMQSISFVVPATRLRVKKQKELEASHHS